MFWIVGLTALGIAGIGFYLRFIIALFRECRFGHAGYWMLLRIYSEPAATPAVVFHRERKPVPRAA